MKISNQPGGHSTTSQQEMVERGIGSAAVWNVLKRVLRQIGGSIECSTASSVYLIIAGQAEQNDVSVANNRPLQALRLCSRA